MEHNCINCKYYRNSQCNSKDFKATIGNTEIDSSIYQIFEEGYLDEFLHENIDIEYIQKNLLEEIEQQGYTKKNKNINKFQSDNFENVLVEEISDKVSRFLINQIKNIKIDITVNKDFGCIYWE